MEEQDAIDKSPNQQHEADIGSGERSPGQHDTDALIDQIGTAPSPPASPHTGEDTTVPGMEKPAPA